MPDNISFNGKDRFWVPLVSLRESGLDDLSAQPMVRKLVAGLPESVFQLESRYGFAIALDLQGNVVANLQSPQSNYAITIAVEIEQNLYMGSLVMNKILQLPLSNIITP